MRRRPPVCSTPSVPRFRWQRSIWLPGGQRIALTFVAVLVALALTGWFASWLTGLPVLRLIRRNLLLGAATMAVGLLIGKVIAI
jgi:VIT1/CCC1 family predicted Fe2+/Mn2+ transporter